jgi:hypothetical protein
MSTEGCPAEYVYLASPYSHHDAAVRALRFLEAERCSHWLLLRRNWNYSPIVYCHLMAQKFGLPTDFAYWQDLNRAMLVYSRAMYILTIDGWRNSTGIAGEREFAEGEGILVRYIEPYLDAYQILAKPPC